MAWLLAYEASSMTGALEEILVDYDPMIVARGRQYVAEGRVTGLRADGGVLRAFVRGTSRYEVSIEPSGDDFPITDCSCPAYARELRCKHVAALAWSVARGGGDDAPRAARAEPLPPILAHVYASSTFLNRLALHAGEAIEHGAERWLPLVDFWRRANGETRARITRYSTEIATDMKTLRAWSPPEPPLRGTMFADLYANLAGLYIGLRESVHVRRCAPGPLDERHPGFGFAYDPRRGLFEAHERRSPLLAAPLAMSFKLAPLARSEPRFEGNMFGAYGTADAWDLFALRAMLLALHARTDDAVVTLERELARPTWDHLLEQLGRGTTKQVETREWAFCIVEARGDAYEVAAFARKIGTSARWKKESFDGLYADGTTPTEREIARVALCSIERAARARIELGTPQAHELLRLLAEHPRVFHSSDSRPSPDDDDRADIVVGDAAMRLEPAPNGMLVPRFFVGDRELSAAMLTPPSPHGASAGRPAFRGVARGRMLASAFVPAPLRPWIDAAEKMGGAFAFPPESVAKLATTTQPLVAAGVAQLPRDALGAELTAEVAPALRVEWHPEGGAVIEVFVSVHPSAPLVAAGMGPTLYTFEHAGRRVFVERDLSAEAKLAEDARVRIANAAPVLWDNAVGRTDTLEEALLLASFLDRNPLGLRIEVTIGRSPSAVAWGEAVRALEVRREGSWLVLDGALKVAGVKLSLGDVLDAARLARRFVKAADGVFLELSKQAIAKLQPLAIASELAEASADGGIRVHDAFGPLLSQAGPLFESVAGVDLEELARRFEARDRSVRVPRLDRGALRPYQKEGAGWMLRLATWAPGCILADDMGLGKTVQTAAILKARAGLGPQLIVAPASVTSNWIAELGRFVPTLRALWYNDDRAIVTSDLGEKDVLVVSYGLLQRCSAAFGAQRWSTVVVDEAQYVKNVTAQRTDAVRTLDRDFTIALTGTPLENHLGELFSIADLVFPGLLGSEPTFREKFRRPIEGQRDSARLGVLGRLLAPFLLRRTRAGVLRELPPREEITEYLDLSPAETKRYLALRRACEQQFAKRKRGETAAQLRIALFAALTRLRQLACDVRLVDPTFEGDSTKIARTVEIAVELAQEGNRALVFSQFTQFLEKIRGALEAAGLRVAYLAGDTPTTRRRAIVDAFQAGEYDVFCVSLLAGGTGLNLTKASYVIHTDPWWNPAAEEQATSRAHRMGQSEPVTVYRLVARGTIEEAVLAMHASKKELAAAVLEGRSSAKSVTSAELLDLLRFGA